MDESEKVELRKMIRNFAKLFDFLCETSDSENWINNLPESEVDYKYYIKLEEYTGLEKIHIHFGQIIVVKEDIDEEEWVTYECNTIYRKVISTKEPSDNKLFMDELYDACDEHFILEHKVPIKPPR